MAIENISVPKVMRFDRSMVESFYAAGEKLVHHPLVDLNLFITLQRY